MTLEVGLSLGVSAKEDVGRFVQIAREAEARGIDNLWVIDSHLAMKDAYSAIAIGLWETDKIHIGTGVTNFQTRDITVTGSVLSTLESIAPARVLAGVGAGDSAVFPLGWRPSKIADLEESLSQLRVLLDGGSIERGDNLVSLPVQGQSRPPIYLSASQKRMLELGGRQADGVIVMGAAVPDLIEQQIATVVHSAKAAGRQRMDVKIDVWVTLSVDDDSEAAINDVRSWASAKARWMSTWTHMPSSLERYRSEMETAAADYDFKSHLSVGARHADGVSDELAQTLAVAGDADTCVSRLKEIAALDIDCLTVSLLSRNREERLRVLTSTVLSALI